jgi:hypothetical protein
LIGITDVYQKINRTAVIFYLEEEAYGIFYNEHLLPRVFSRVVTKQRNWLV